MDYNNEFDVYKTVPAIPLRGLVVYPGMTLHFDVGRKKSIKALNTAMENDQLIFLVAQTDPSIDDPTGDDVFGVGVVCEVRQMMKIPNSSNYRVIVKGIQRATLIDMFLDNGYFSATIENAHIIKADYNEQNEAYVRLLKKEYEEYASMFKKISNDVVTTIIETESVGELCNIVCENSFFSYKDKQSILEEFDETECIKKLLLLIKKEITTLHLEAEIQEKLQKEVDKNQREYYLREEMKVISDELGEGENPAEEADEYRNKISSLKCDDKIKDKLYKECDKLMKMPSGSHEGTVIRTYLDKCLQIPFGKYSKDRINLKQSRSILDKDHFGLNDVKDRITEALAVLKRSSELAGQIICLAGPPGVGKTSIVKSLAKSMNREYVRIALGGVHDEAEIRGHRRTYIGAMAGRITEALISAKTMNPIILLDEIDKVGSDYKGDPASALLEALDPEQNSTFNDHYIDFPLDLSKVLFITTANDTSLISAPLYDRMEIIELSSYSPDEKFNIAKKHLVKKEILKHGLTPAQLKISDSALHKIIKSYTREAGVRGLEKQIATLCRKACMELESGKQCLRINEKNLSKYLGTEKYDEDIIPSTNQIGVVNGLAWTQVGGTMLPIEVSALNGTGKIELTGNLGDVMKESAKIAVSFIRSQADKYFLDSDFYKTKDIHIHAPEGAIPKDGPSAGLAITTAILSELSGIPIKHNIAMTGEISLKGNALAIGGLKEKSMAAYKAGCDTIIIPKDNLKDLTKISDEVKNNVNFVSVSSFDEVAKVALEYMPNKKDSKVIINTNAEAGSSAAVTQ
ncbi:endopeptidase La [Eubacterium sp.]|uniref:endopeptidase La n=1 Tax=Eubacterium sp. TaxID=142586 RepID=UPI0025C115E6|nr:endopeptidase La [Eubacterium sp.]MCI7800246.1 endopeptidase La [Eubacterium sp.]